MVVLCPIMGRTAICVIVLQRVRSVPRPTQYRAPAGPLWVCAYYACTRTVMGLNPIIGHLGTTRGYYPREVIWVLRPTR